MHSDAASTMDLASLIILILAACLVVGAWFTIAYYQVRHIRSSPSWTTNESIRLRPNTRVGCGDGTCYLSMFSKRYKDRILNRLGYFPTIIALASISKTYRRRVRGKLELVGDGMAHFERCKDERQVWDVVDELVGRVDWVGTNDLRIISSVPPEGYRYLQLFKPEHRNSILQFLGPNPHLQAVIDIDASYRTRFIGVLWKKETDRYCLEKELYMDVWGCLDGWVIRAEARIN